MGGLNVGYVGLAPKSWNKKAKEFFEGTEGKQYQKSKLRPSQEPLAEQAINAGIAPGAGGAYGDAADYYRSNLSNNPADFDAFAAPDIRQFNEETIPGISEQFAGMGSGGLSSSSFRNAAVNAGTDLSERLGVLRAQLRSNSAKGLQDIGQAGLQSFDENISEAPTPGFLEKAAPAAIDAAATYFSGGAIPPGTASTAYSQIKGGQSNRGGPQPRVNSSSNLPKFGSTGPYG